MSTTGGHLPVISMVGKSGVGKTTVLERVIVEIKRRGYKVGTIKHDTHGFEVDRPGKDSWRHRRAGAQSTLVVGDTKVALIKDDPSSYIEKMEFYLSDRDIILAEGFKKQALPKIEIFRTESVHESPLCLEDENLIAFVTDSDHRPDVPVFGLEDIGPISDFIENNFLKNGCCGK